MSNDFYNHDDGVPASLTRGASTLIRGEFDLVQAAFDKLPSLVQTFGASANYAVAAGLADAWTASVAPTVLTSYTDGMQVRVKFPSANATTTPTLNVNGLGGKQIVAENGAAVGVGDISTNMVVALTYNASTGKLHMIDSALFSSAAAASAAAAAASRAAIDNRWYPGTYSSFPATRPDGSAVQAGDVFEHTNTHVYTFLGGNWTDLTVTTSVINAFNSRISSLEGNPGITSSPLAYAYDTGFSIDAFTDTLAQAVTVKTGNAVTQSPLDTYFTWNAAAMRVLKDGTIGWSAHNFMPTPLNPSNGTFYTSTGLTIGTGYGDTTGGNTAFLLTATGAAANLDVVLFTTPFTVITSGRYYGVAHKFYFDPAGSRFGFVRWDVGASQYHAYFDLQAGTITATDAGLTAAISNKDGDGNTLPQGWYMVYSWMPVPAASMHVKIGPCNASGAETTTAGKYLRFAEAMSYYGVKPMRFVGDAANATAYGAAYSWEPGSRSMMVYGGASYTGIWSEDLTNAAWTKTSCTPALTSTGISGEPCSQLTATAINATCLQAVTSAGTTQTFQPYVRRKTGTGAISITMDNGGTWTDITAQINSTTYTRLPLHGSLANPTIGFKIATSGDVIEVCHANNTQSRYVVPPMAVREASLVVSGNYLQSKVIPVSLSGNVLAYYDGYLPNDPGLLSPANWSALSLASSTNGSMLAAIGEGWLLQDGGALSYEMFGATSAGQRIEGTMYLAGTSGGNYCSINGEPPACDYQRSVTGLDRFNVGGNGATMQFVRKILLAPTTLANRDLVRTKHYQQGVFNGLFAASVVAGDHEFAATDMNREPAVSILKDFGDSVLLGVFWMARDRTAYNSECPARLMQRNYLYDKDENSLVPVTNAAIVFQNSRWSSNLGHSQSPVVIRVPSGANAGRLIMLFSNEDSVSGTQTGDARNIYIMTNDQGGDPTGWSAATKLFDHSALSSAFLIPSPGGDYVILPPTHPVAPNRIVAMIYADGNRIASIYSNDWGATWSLGSTITNGVVGYSEPTLTTWPDGTVITTIRSGNSTGNNRRWAKSIDGGVTFTDQGTMPSIVDADCSASTVQLDPTGVTGTYGRIAMSHPTVDGQRIGFQIGFATDATLQLLTSKQVVNPRRYFGYSGLRALFGGEYLACAVEGGRASGNIDNSAYLLIIKP